MKRFIGFSVIVLLILGCIGYVFRIQLVMAMLPRVVLTNMTRNLIAEQPDGLHLMLCGAGSPLPDPNRSGPCVAVIAGDRFYVVDSGSGSPRVIQQVGLPLSELEAVFLTHLHSDHIDGLGELQMQHWAGGGADAPLPIYGPAGVEAIVDGINLMYGPSRVSRVAHHGEEVVPLAGAGGVARPFVEPKEGELIPLLKEGDLTVSAFKVNHFPVEPAVGYRFDYKGRSIVISGDTVKSANLEHYSEGVDLLVHEALDSKVVARMAAVSREQGFDRRAKLLDDILGYHATPVEAAEIARDAEVGHLLYYHVVPPLLLAPLEAVFLEGVDEVYEGPVTLGRDGTFIVLPAGTDEIDSRDLL